MTDAAEKVAAVRALALHGYWRGEPVWRWQPAYRKICAILRAVGVQFD